MWKTAARPWRAPSWRLQQEKGRLETQWSALASECPEAAQNSAEPSWVKVPQNSAEETQQSALVSECAETAQNSAEESRRRMQGKRKPDTKVHTV